MIWFSKANLEEINKRGNDTLTSHLGIIVTEIGDDYIKGTLNVDKRTIQPYGILHGGASGVFAETLGSIASNLCIDNNEYVAVGLNLFVSHIKKGVKGEMLEGVCKPNHLGKKTHIWDIELYNEQKQLISKSTLTTTILPRHKLKD
ncbi:MAG: hotdog fold thioesterase [Bacteriovoracaceae bacterium]